MTDLTIYRQDKSAILNALQEAGANITNPAAIKCPFHEDKHPSAGVFMAEDGAWKFKCHGCDFHGDVFDVKAKARQLPLADVLREVSDPPKAQPRIFSSIEEIKSACPGEVEEVYQYTDPDTGETNMVVVRCVTSTGKTFRQASPVFNGWVMQAPSKPWPIYNRTRIQNADRIIVVEGEKCVHALNAIGTVATTSPGGAGKAQYADWALLAGKEVYLWPDNDSADKGVRKGIAHMRDVQKRLESLDPAPQIYWVDPDSLNLPDKGDVCDWIDSGGDVETVLAFAESVGASSEVQQLLRDTASGKRRSVSLPFSATTRLSRALLPDTLTLICGDPGSAKSFFMLQCAMHWHEKGLKIAVLELEENRAWHNCRVLALRSGVPDILDDMWVRSNHEQWEMVFNEHRAFLDTFGSCIHTAPAQHMELTDVAVWVETQLEHGCRVVAIDPVTAAASGPKPWIDDAKFVARIKRAAEQFEASIMLVTHPRKGIKGSSLMEDMAGGAAYSRFAQCVLWLKRYNPPRDVTVMDQTGFGTRREVCKADRILSILKARNASGSGLKLAFNFEGNQLRFQELGVCVDNDASK